MPVGSSPMLVGIEHVESKLTRDSWTTVRTSSAARPQKGKLSCGTALGSVHQLLY